MRLPVQRWRPHQGHGYGFSLCQKELGDGIGSAVRTRRQGGLYTRRSSVGEHVEADITFIAVRLYSILYLRFGVVLDDEFGLGEAATT